MTRRTAGLCIGVLFTVLALLFAPPLSAATIYRVNEYYVGLPADYKGDGWEGFNFNSTLPTGTKDFSLGARNITTTDGTRYTCVGWKNGIGNGVHAAGTERSMHFDLTSDVSVTWIYQKANKLTIKAVSTSNKNSIWGAGQNTRGDLGNGAKKNTFFLSEIMTGDDNDYIALSVGVYNHGAAIRADGSLWTWGRNDSKQLGDDTTTDRLSPINVFTTSDFIDVAASSDTTAAIKSDGSLWAWGANDVGQLGNGTKDTTSGPVQVGKDLDWRSVTAGLNYFMAIRSDGSLWSWGENDNGRLGFSIDGNVNQSSPGRVGALADNWSLAVAGVAHSAGIKDDGSLWLWGYNSDGQIGIGTKADGKIGSAGTKADVMTPSQVMLGSRWVAVAPGYYHTLAIREDGTLWAWGSNAHYELGTGDTADCTTPKQIGSDSDWRSVAAGEQVSMAIKNDGTLWGWGKGPLSVTNETEQLTKKTPTKIGASTSWLKLSVGTFNGGSYERIMAIRTTNRVESTPHLGMRVLPAGEQYSLSAQVVPTNGDSSYFLSAYSGATGDITGSGTAYNLNIPALTKDTVVTWSNQQPDGTPHDITVSFKSGTPAAVKSNSAVFPNVGTTSFFEGQSVTLTASQSVTLTNGDIWDNGGWSGTGDVPLTGTKKSYKIKSVSQKSSIVWKYIKRAADAVIISYAVSAPASVQSDITANAEITLYKQTTTIGLYDEVTSKVFSANDQIKVTAKAALVVGGATYYCTGISVTDGSNSYTSPVVVSDEGDLKAFLITVTQKSAQMDFTLIYVNATRVNMGAAVPTSCLTQQSDIASNVSLVKTGNGADTVVNSFYWSSGNKLYPVRPIPDFTVTCGATVSTYFSDWKPDLDLDKVVVGAPVNLQPANSSYDSQGVMYSESYSYGQWNLDGNSLFQPPAAGKSLIRLSKPGVDTPYFITVNAVATPTPVTDTSCVIGSVIKPPAAHTDPETGKNGYVFYPNAYYDGAGSDPAYVRKTRSGDIFPVNTNVSALPEQDMVVAWYSKGSSGPAAAIGWPLAANFTKYVCSWPTDPEVISVPGAGISLGPKRSAGSVYNQPDRTLPGFNPNEEHAFMQGDGLYALRTDLNNKPVKTSLPYVLLKYKNGSGNWAMTVYKVSADTKTTYSIDAGELLQPPTPLNLLPLTTASLRSATDTAGAKWYYQDHNGGHWAMASNDLTTASQSTIKMQWYYPLQPGFYYPYTYTTGEAVKIGDPIPFQNGGSSHTDPPREIGYAVSWPTATAPVLQIGDTLTTAKNGLPDVSAMASVKKIFDEGTVKTPSLPAALLFAPYAERFIALKALPSGMNIATISGGKSSFTDLPYALRSRLLYDPIAGRLVFKGISLDMGSGNPLLLPNIMTATERTTIKNLFAYPGDNDWNTAVDKLYAETIRYLTLTAQPPVGVPQALSAGYAQHEGYVVLAENDDAALGSAPVALHIINVSGGPFTGDVKVIKSDNPFDEKLTLRHSGDFAGNTDKIYYTWYYRPDTTGVAPPLPTDISPSLSGWTRQAGGWGMNDITIQGAGKMTLEDNWFMVRYYYGDNPKTTAPAFDPVFPSLATDKITPSGTIDVEKITNYWSSWAGDPGGSTAMLAEGWIKRVTSGLNPFDARVADFRNNATNTTVSMISQAGARYNGAIALNGSAANLNNIGLIEAYQTVLDRGESFSINATPPILPALPDIISSATNAALLNAATRIAGFYTLLGNEAYSDAQDPTVGYDTRGGQSGAMASSIFAFQNQVDSLLEEELALLRGRDSSTGSISTAPFYNRLPWNFTNGDGEVAYVQTYNISDKNGDGFINELDAKIMYPQGHGDAWGHYLTAMTTWYDLLTNSNYVWTPRTESILVAGAPVQVDYLDERKFAQTAAYKAQTGAEIVDLTYRKMYTNDPAGQYQGYKDSVLIPPVPAVAGAPSTLRAWGLDDWARRSGQGAYMDWVTANSLLPALDSVHSGIQKIDRITVTELKGITSQFQRIQSKIDQANAGDNPLGLAPGVVPFDIDPNLLVAAVGRDPQSHFEQIYGRAVKALDNARTVYDYASQYAQLIRGNEDTLSTFSRQVANQEQSYRNQLIEIFGYPYAGDIGTGKTYPDGYTGADFFHYNYMDIPDVTGMLTGQPNSVSTVTFNTDFLSGDKTFAQSAVKTSQTLDVAYPLTIGMPWNFSIPAGWGVRRAPGEIQMALQDLLRTNALYQKSLKTYSATLSELQQIPLTLEALYNIKADQIKVTTKSFDVASGIESTILYLTEIQNGFNLASGLVTGVATATAEALPKVVGVDNDVTSVGRAALLAGAVVSKDTLEAAVKGVGAVVTAFQFSEAQYARNAALTVSIDSAKAEVTNLAANLQVKVNSIYPMVMDLYAEYESMQQSLGKYQAALAKGERLMDELETYRKQTAGDIQDYRYQDLGFRTFRNDALQKYRSTFDLASRYAYLAVTAYDYETNLLRSDKSSGATFLDEIVKQRSPGVITDGVPTVGSSGLADSLARLNGNFGVYKTQLGFNNPQSEATPFSLRTEFMRIKADTTSTPSWQNELNKYKVADLNKNEAFLRYCRPFTGDTTTPQPGLVIPFATQVRSGNNFFGFPLGSGDSSYDPGRFATKIRSVGLWFKGYDKAGLSTTPRAYLVPAGADVLRSPLGNSFDERQWQVVDQKLPVPFPVTTDEIANGDYSAVASTLSGALGDIRRFSSIRAYNDSGVTGTAAEQLAQMNTDSSLIGRSVWNGQWLLIIPGSYLLNDPAAGVTNFINNVSDIRLFFQTYSYSGN